MTKPGKSKLEDIDDQDEEEEMGWQEETVDVGQVDEHEGAADV